MASDVEELSEFLLSLNILFNQIQHVTKHQFDDQIYAEHCKNKLEDYLSIVVAMSVKVNSLSEPGIVQGELQKDVH